MNQITTINAERRTALRKDAGYIHIMKYMGSKRELLPDIKEEIAKIANKNDGVLDLFAGTGSVGLYLKDEYNVISNDIQKYSHVICDALISSSSKKLSFNTEDALEALKKNFTKNKKKLHSLFPQTLLKSNEFVDIKKGTWTDAQRKKYISFFETFPTPINEFKAKSVEQNDAFDLYLERQAVPSKFPYMQTFFLFAETYFSTEQCFDIDSLKYAIDVVFNNPIEKSIALTALIYAHSYSSSGTGHFAMFRDLKDVKSISDVFLYRDRSVWSLFEKKFREIIEFHNYDPSKKHFSVSEDYEELLNNKKFTKKYKVIYADPPYSFVHYSRFYHATESLVVYDYILPEFKGRYRTDRHQSPFCQKLNVQKAFEVLFNKASENNKYVVLSYADTGMISFEEIIKIIKLNGMEFTFREVDYDHSTMGREGHKSNKIKEYLITAKPPTMN